MRPTSRPEGRFEQLWLPLWPLASDNLREGIYRTSREKALDKRYVETNPDALSNLLVVDVDHDDALLRALWERHDWLPNAVVENPLNGHAHAVWDLLHHSHARSTPSASPWPTPRLSPKGYGALSTATKATPG